MAESDRARLVRPDDRVEADPTPGMVREQALESDGMWAGFVRTGPNATSGWHHHGEYESTIFVVAGGLRMESGPGGTDVVEAREGDFLYIPKGAIHREGNPDDTESHIVVVRAGHGPPTINVDGPAPS
jgi:uncharacterized RmlC-like cupin family protein